jgi:hypothetical protein
MSPAKMMTVGLVLLVAAFPSAASKNFKADVTFKGSSLSGWRPLGQADWRAQDGEIIATPKSSAGWLLLERSYQDVAFYASFRCAPGC